MTRLIVSPEKQQSKHERISAISERLHNSSIRSPRKKSSRNSSIGTSQFKSFENNGGG